jgi:hypothetical protein
MIGSLNEVAPELFMAVERNRLTCEELVAVEPGACRLQPGCRALTDLRR